MTLLVDSTLPVLSKLSTTFTSVTTATVIWNRKIWWSTTTDTFVWLIWASPKRFHQDTRPGHSVERLSTFHQKSSPIPVTISPLTTGHSVFWSLSCFQSVLLSEPRTTWQFMRAFCAVFTGNLMTSKLKSKLSFSVQFPYKISRKAESIIKALCRQDPSERIGYQRSGLADIRKHRWFQVSSSI